jgi:ubiquinone/menaquinone biosynthesis C-methylase UbiE
MFQRFFARQLARPSGLFGRYFMPRWLQKHTKQINRWALERLDVRRDDQLLEIGFGGGDLLFQVLSKERPAYAVGIDLSEEMVYSVRKRLGAFIQQERLEILRGSVDDIPFEDGRFTKLISVNTLYFWPSPASALAECRRVLVVGGTCALCFDSKADLESWPGHKFGFRLYETAEVEQLLQDARFGIVSSDSCSISGYGKAHCIVAQAV